jgi:hypothetical protein
MMCELMWGLGIANDMGQNHSGNGEMGVTRTPPLLAFALHFAPGEGSLFILLGRFPPMKDRGSGPPAGGSYATGIRRKAGIHYCP